MTSESPPESAASLPDEKDFIVVGIGASAGGIKALKEFFGAMPPNPRMAFVVVLHLSPDHESSLAAVIQSETSLPVAQVNETVTVRSNHIYVIPPNRSLIMVDGTVQPTKLSSEYGSRTAIDVFFRTLSEAYGRRAVCVILSGTGTDGTSGLKVIKGRNGFAVVQLPEDAEYDGMPRSAIATNLVDVVLPARDIPAKLVSVRSSTEKFNLIDGDDEKATPGIKGAEVLHEILTLLRVRTGHDFTSYKRPTLLRRIARHLQIHDLDDMAAYVELLRGKPEEVQSLLHNLLINVTNFFRDKKVFEVLELEIIPRLFVNKGANEQIRIWVAGCASGEEAYSIGMLLYEYAASRIDAPKLQIFATDVDEEAIAQAREGRYLEAIETDVSAERLQRFFSREGNYYRIKKKLREVVLFAAHNVLRDPPFSRLDLVSCRNLMIYLNKTTQEKLLQIFHFALNPSGYLFLGSSESAETEPPLFTPVDKMRRIYTAERTPSSIQSGTPIMPVTGQWQVKIPQVTHSPHSPRDLQGSFGELHYKLVEHYAPPSVLANDEFDICHLSDSAGRYLHFSGGEPSVNLLKAIHPDLLPDLRAALFAAKHDNKLTEFQNISCELDGKKQFINIIVRPIAISADGQRFLLVTFDEDNTQAVAVEHVEQPGNTIAGDDAMESVVRRLEEDLRRTKDRLRATIEQHETSIEELKASNEELQAMNEELRSATEELETSKEELQSVNEELTTVNTELKGKVEEVGWANSDLQNLMASTDIGTIFLDRALRIKRYTPRIRSLFNIIPSDIGRPLEHLTHRLNYKNFSGDAELVLKNLHTLEREISSDEAQTFLLRYLPYRTLDDRIDGVVLTFIDVTERNAAADNLRRSEERFRAIVNQAMMGVGETNLDGRIIFVNQRFCSMTGYSEAELLEKHMQDIMHPDDVIQNRQLFERMTTDGTPVESEKRFIRKDGSTLWVQNNVTLVRDRHGDAVSTVAVLLDIGERIRIEEKLREADRQKDEFLATLSHELRNPLAPLQNGLTILRRSFGDRETTDKTLQMMERQTRHIVHLVDDLLDVARISFGKIALRKEQFEIKTAIELAIDSVRPMLQKRNMELNLDVPEEPIELYMDLNRVAQVISNILDNAVKYNKVGGKVWLSVRRQANEVAVHVRDNGIGVSAAMLPKIFDLFSQSDVDNQGGLGIGLNLVKSVVEMQGGRVDVHSDGKNRGTEFIVHLPVDGNIPHQSKILPKSNDAPVVKRRIMIVDDNVDTADSLNLLLTSEGHETITAYNGTTALKSAMAFKPEVALLDIGMPDMNGYDLAIELRRQFPELLLIAVSGWGQEQDRERSRNSGFRYHFVKPVELHDLIQVLKQL